MLMAVELPALSIVVARLADPAVNLAAWGSVAYSLALIIESPIIMMLSASTALCRDWASYLKVRRFMMAMGATLTLLHVLLAFTPLYDLVVVGLIDPPTEVVEPARLGLMIMIPWSWAIGYRRFNQGVLIRFGHSRAVGLGTAVRLGTDGVMLIVGYLIHSLPGIVVAASTVVAGVLAEAIYSGVRVRPVLRDELRPAPAVDRPLNLRIFLSFYVPLAMTSLMTLLIQPMVSAAISRMPDPLQSLAVWPVISGMLFLLRSMGLAYNEVVIALFDEPGALPPLRRFTALLAAFTSLVLFLFLVTPLATFWLRQIAALPLPLARLAYWGLWIVLPVPGLAALQSWYQGMLLHSERTRSITVAVAISLVTSNVILWTVVVLSWVQFTGLYVGLVAFGAGLLMQVLWLWYRSRAVVREARAQTCLTMTSRPLHDCGRS
jgi:hypothetical protein